MVFDPPSWRVQPDDTETVAGKSVVLPCAAEGSPSPRILWKKNTGAVPPLYQELNSLMENYKIMQNGSLVIYNTRPEDSGYYMCQASNGVGVALSKVIYLTVHVPARFSKQFQNVTAPKGSSAIINCTAEGDTPVSIKWYHGGEEINMELDSRMTISEDNIEKGSSSILIFKNVDREDTSLFVCVAKNKYGTDHSEMWLVVQEPPEAPLSVHVSNYSSRTINLTWEQPHTGNSPIISYIIQYKNSSVSWQKNVPQIVVNGEMMNGSIKDLMPAHVYHIRIFAENSIGISNSSEVLTVTTLEEVPEAPPRDVRVTTKNSEALIVTWEPPERYLQHGDVMGYYIGYRLANSTDTFHYETHEVLPGMPLRHILTNLKKYTQYTILVQAYNRVGAGPRSQEVSATTDEDEVFMPSEHITRDQKVELSKLDHFCNYSIEVRAFTSKGDGVGSQPIICATQEDVPGEPENMKVLVADLRTMLVSWLPPLYPNGKIKQYRIYMRSLDGMTLDADQFDIPSEQTYYTISYLETHNRYEFWVTAFTAVGEGAESRHVVQATTEHAPAQIAPFSQHVVGVLHEDLKLSCLAVGQPAPQYYWRKNGNAIQEDSRLQIIQGKLLVISPLERTDAGNYSCLAENIFGRDQIAYFVTIHESQNKGIPLVPSEIEISSTTASSIALQWQLPPDAGHVLEGLYLYHKREFGEWEKTKLRAQDSNFILNNLQCGTKYYFYLQTFNQLGQSEPTSTITACTQGSAPVAPKNSDLIKVNSSFILLNLTSWDDGGCHITSIVIEYKVKDETMWTLVSNNVKTEQLQFIVLDLNPGTWYNLRVTAHNSAGSTVEHYDFVTLTHLGATVAPELIVYYGYGRKPFYSEMAVIVPAATGITITIAAAAILFAYLKKNHTIMSSNTYRDKHEDPEQLSDLGKKVLQDRADSSDCGKMSPSLQEPVYLPTPVRVSLGYRQDISPYATFQVPAPGGPDCSDCEEDLESHDRNHKLADKDGSSTDSTYSKIHRKLQHGNETPEWIPLHNLYQAHRY
ncbi:Down syndrome cell adhesion molecule-like protein Dscam2 [Schistocerca cancellata]|uniref:Down syndrome cell adhesion molecule-like protein Dscam2 n=1 Tax=Schistocerca cancellata TaxID=274614 RepID=UPI002117D8C8|nr:Down syndrome cell adhesion molecule-like protein Dscam2 [Schistocerca cancellata]